MCREEEKARGARGHDGGPAEAWHQGVARKEGEAFQGSREEESEGSAARKPAGADFFLSTPPPNPAVPAPGSSGKCLRLQVSVCCRESSKWLGVRGEDLLAGVGPLE